MPPTADTAAAPKRTMRRTVPIIPAIPHKLSRRQQTTRPITPDEIPSEPKPVTQHEAQPAAQPQQVAEEPHLQQTIPDPLTPDTQTSGANNDNTAEPSAPSSSADVHVDASVEELQETRDMTTITHNVPRSGAATASQPLAPPARNQLPPPFYPSEQLAAQTQAVEDANVPSYTHFAQVPSHALQASADGIVFGALQDSPAVPSTPHEVEADVRAQVQPVPHQPPGLMRPEFANQFYPGHAHHLSRSQTPWMPPALAAAPPDGPYGNAATFPPSQFPGPGTYDGVYNGRLSPGRAALLSNGAGSSRSQSPSKPQFSATQPTSEHGDDRRPSTYQNGNSAQAFAAPPKLDMPFELLAYLNSQLGNAEYADYILRVRSPNSVLIELPVHSIIVARSPAIAYAIQRGRSSLHQNAGSLTHLELLTQDRFVTADSVNEALKNLYGAPLFATEGYCYGLRPFFLGEEQGPSSGEARNRMAGAISYAAAGKLFALSDMHKRGIDLIRSLLRWDTIEMALEYGLEESIYSRARNDLARGASNLMEFDATHFLDRECLDFLAYGLLPSFKLYNIAPEIQGHPRLPTFVEAKQPVHNPRLSGIRFGDIPPEDALQPNYITRVLSVTLLSLPMPLLDRLLTHAVVVNQLGWPGVEQLMQDVIRERESRRKKALGTSQRQPYDKNSPPPQRMIDNLLYEEQVKGHTLLERHQAQQLNHF